MKKIKFLTVLGISLCTFFIFNLNYKASASDNFMKLETDNMTMTYALKDEGTLTTLYEVTVFIDTIHELENNVILYFKPSKNFTLRTPLNRGYNSYEIIALNMTDNNKWELHYEISLLNTLLNDYGNDTNYILSELIDIFIETKIEVKPPLDYNFVDEYGDNLTYMSFNLKNDFQLTDTWSNGDDTYIFRFTADEQILQDLFLFWDYNNISKNFINIYSSMAIDSPYQYLSNTNSIPEKNIGWTSTDEYIYMIIKQDYIDVFQFFDTPLEWIDEHSDYMIVDTWLVSDTSSYYQDGYNVGYDEGYQAGKLALTEDLINYYLYDEFIVATPIDIGDIHKFDGWSVFSPYENNANVILYDVDKRYLTIGVDSYHDDVLIYVKENITTASTVMLANVPDDLGSYRDDFDFTLRTSNAIDEFTIDNQIFYTFDMLPFYQDCKIAIDVWGYEIDYDIFSDVINNSLRIYFTDEPLNLSLLTDYYFKGYDDGYRTNITRETAYQTGYDDGYNNGLKANDEDIYKEGFKEGANETFIGSIDKWLVPAIIVVMLLGGFFAIARKKRDGDI